jgi:hypothetical protein
VATVAGAVGWATAQAAGSTLLAGLAGLAAAEAVLVAGLALTRRRLLADAWTLAARAVRNSLAGGAEPERTAVS